MDALIYARLSEDREPGTEVAGGVATSVDRQVHDCLKWCELHGHRVAGIYRDEGISGFSGARRPEFERLLADARNGVGRLIVVWRLDRLSRNRPDFTRVLDMCDGGGIQLASVTESLDTSTPTGEAMRDIIAIFARMESRNISVRVARARLEAAMAGRPVPGGARPYGYAADKVTIIEAEADVLREAARRVIRGESLRSVAREFNARGLRPVQAAKFSAGNLGKLLANPRYISRAVYKGVEVADGQWPPILTVAVHEQLKAVLSNPARRSQAGRPPVHLLVGGILRCGVCGDESHPVALGARAPDKSGRRYGCDGGDREAGRVHLVVAAAPLERFVTDAVLEALDGPKLGKFLKLRATNGDRELGDQLVADERRLRDLATMYARDEIDKPEWLVARPVLLQRIRSARERLARRAEAAILADVGPEPGALAKAWQRWTLEQRRDVLRLVLEAVIVSPATRRGPGFDESRVELKWRA
jgi:DNA invertase Pin-like site-specific DNA recombinase